MDITAFDTLEWTHLQDMDGFGYPIDYWVAIPGMRDDGHIDLLFRWEPDRYCHFHRHIAHTTSVVLQGQLTVIDTAAGKEVGRRVRGAGDYSQTPQGDVHMELGGPEGALVLFNLYAPDGVLFEMLDLEENVLMPVSIDDVLGGALGVKEQPAALG